MSGFNLLHLITKSQPVTLRSCSLPSGACRTKKTWPVSFSQEELKKRLTPMQYHVTQERGTESAFTGEFTHLKDEGSYACVVCGSVLFSSNTKFDSGSGWPSFYDLVKEESVSLTDDFSYGMHRVEATCSQVNIPLALAVAGAAAHCFWFAELTWDTYLMMDQNPQGSATALTRPHWVSSPKTRPPPPPAPRLRVELPAAQ